MIIIIIDIVIILIKLYINSINETTKINTYNNYKASFSPVPAHKSIRVQQGEPHLQGVLTWGSLP